MRRISAAIATLGLLTGAALAQPAPFTGASSGNTNPLTATALNAAIAVRAPQVADLATLQSWPSTFSPAVWRDDYATGIGAPPLLFRSQGGTCAAGGMVNDGGSCVNASDGNSWKAALPAGPDIREWGASNGGSVNAAAGLQAAMTWACVNNAEMEIPAGVYLLSSPVAVSSCQRFSIHGAGSSVTRLYWPSGNGLSISSTSPNFSFKISGLALATGSANAGTGLAVTNTVFEQSPPPSILQDVTTTADVAGGTHYWTNAIVLSAISFVNIDSYTQQGDSGDLGNGLTFQGNGTAYAIVLNLTNSSLLNGKTGLTYGSYAQGVTVTNCNFTNGVTGILVPSAATNNYQLSVVGSQFNTSSNQIEVDTNISDLNVTNSLFFVPAGNSGIDLSAFGVASQIIGNNFRAAGGFSLITANGIYVGSNLSSPANAAVITGNTFQYLSSPITLASSTSGWKVAANAYNNATNPVQNSSTSNTITGAVFPAATAVTGAVNNGSGAVRLTVSSSANFVTGEAIDVESVGGVPNAVGIQSIAVIDGTHIDLLGAVFSGTYTSGGVVSALP